MPGKIIEEECFYVEDAKKIRILFHFNGISLSVKYYDPGCNETDHAVLTALFTRKWLEHSR